MSRRLFLSALLLSNVFSLSLAARAGTIIHVPADQPTIQAGINAASNGDTVQVSAGTYYETINFNGKAITVTSANGPGTTTIDGSKGNYTPTVTFFSNETKTSVLSGFTIQNAYYEQISISSSSPTIQGNIIRGFSSGNAAGIAIQNGSAIIQGNLIVGNAQAGVSSYSGSGSQITGNLIAGNSAVGVVLNYSSALDSVQQNTIIENGNGGISYYSFGSAGVTLVQNLIAGNLNLGLNVAANGGPVTMISNTIASNQAGCCGQNSPTEAQIDQFNTSTTIQNNLIVAAGESPAFSCSSYVSAPVFTNNDVFAANNSAYSGSCPDPTGANGNISADPLFVDLLSDNFHIQPGSPAIDAGINSAPDEPKTDFDGDARSVGGTIDIGADEYATKTALSLSSYDLHYPSQDVGTTSSPQVVTLTNQKTTAVTLNLIATGPNYSQTNNCGTSLAAGASCQISVTFAPLAGGTIRSVLGILSGATLNPLAVNLLGTGLSPQAQIYAPFYFYNQVVGTPSTQTGTLTNTGQAPLSISSILFTGAADFVESNNCPIAPNTLAAGAQCTITVTYTPTIVGSEYGTITFNDNALPSPQTVNVNGSSVSAGVPTITPTSLTFPTTLIGLGSTPQTATLTNTGTGPMGVTNIYSYGDFPQTNNCPAILAVGASCTLSVTYTPSYQGTENGYVWIYTDSQYFQASLNVSGTGQAAAPTATSLSTTSVPAGSATTQITITGTGFVGNSSQVLWNGAVLPCCAYINGSTQINFSIPAANLATAGTYQINVYTPAPGGGTSNSLPFVVYQPINYAVSSTKYNYRTISGTNLNLSYYSAAQIISPFPLQFGGGSYTNLTVGAGGTISFNGFASEYNDVIPTSQTPTLVAPFWATLFPFGNGNDNNVFWDVTGIAHNRELVIEWRDVTYCCNYDPNDTIRFQVVFFEGSSNILFNYADTVFGGPYSNNDMGATATAGVQVANGVGTQFSYDQPALKSKSALLWYPGSPTVTLSTGSLGFGYHQIGSKSLRQKVTLTNGSVVPLVISNIAIDNGDFLQTNTCGASLAPHKSCAIHVAFKPSLPSAETATLSINDNATSSPQTVALSGIGSITSVVVYPILANFGNVPVGQTGTVPVVLANGANKSLTIQQITATPTVYTETNNCGVSLAAGASCTVSVTFTPVQQGNISGKLSMGLNGKPVVTEVKLAGSGQ
jgi:Right handed beta helix region/Abnormal spindle-like microcephaly-assoc'd, ASPM-SPD-2-Hydin